MAAFDLEEQEQLSELKTWWRMYGTLLLGVVCVVLLALVAWQAWNWNQRTQSGQASMIYAGLQNAASAHDAKRTREAAGELTEKFPRTAYAAMGALISARVQFEAGDVKSAKAGLQWVIDKSNDAAFQDLARLRLAHILFDEKAYDEAIKLLNAGSVAAFAPRLAELKGDILAEQGKKAEAQAAYLSAVSKLETATKEDGKKEEGKKGEAKKDEAASVDEKIDADKKSATKVDRESNYRELLQMKADALGDK